MAGPRGYSSYRGRLSVGKMILAAVLVLVIVISCGVIYFQQHIVYDESGRPQMPFSIPWLNGGEEEDPSLLPEDLSDVDVIIQEPEGIRDMTPTASREVNAFSLPAGPLTLDGWQEALESRPDWADAVSVTMKDGSGRVYFDSRRALPKAVSTEDGTGDALMVLLSSRELYSIARVSCLRDPRAASSDISGMALKNTGGYIFYDGENTQWLDPAKPKAREYVCALAEEIAILGFDEVILTDLTYPTVGKLDKIAYGDGPKENNLTLLLLEICKALADETVVISVELSPEVILGGDEGAGGISLDQVIPWVDRIYAKTEPDQAAALAAAVGHRAAALGRKTAFVPELEENTHALSGSRLVLG